ncbi:MAG: hypothetical protein JWN37_704 [Candidatus Nomurabacteria bacterium]|nr:hypothetical protein [Candidatus Nomurabacteria bacterium]
MKIFLITDIHYGLNTNYKARGGPDHVNQYGELVSDFKNKIQHSMNECDLIINMGDLIHQTKSKEEDVILYKEAIEILSGGKPIKHVIGNHDLVNLNRNDITKIIGEDKIYYSFDFGGYHHVVIDGNREEGKVSPEPFLFSDDQINWLEDDLNKTSLKTVVYCHFPIYEQDVSKNIYFKEAARERITPLKSEKIRNVFEKSGKVLAVFNGHTHFKDHENINGVDYFTVGSFSENDGADRPTTEYAVVTIDNDKLQIAHKRLI